MRDETTGSNHARSAPGRLLWSRWILALALLGAAMALGALHTLVLVLVTTALAVAAVLAWYGAEPLRARAAATVLFWVGVGLTGYTLLQCVPVPASWLAAVAPENADTWARSLLPLREPGPGWVPLTLDPVATKIQILRGVAYLLAFVAALRIAGRREGVTFLEVAVAVTGVALAIAAWAHPAVGAERVFGIYRPIDVIAPRHLSPLINPNTLAAYLNIAFCLALAQAVSPRPYAPRPLSIAVVAILVATQLWVASRGGVLSMGVGAMLVIWMTRVAVEHHRRSLQVDVLVPVVLALAGVGLLVLAGSEDAWGELADTGVSKIDFETFALASARHFPLFGMGRGAFESVFPAFEPMFPAYRGAAGHIVFTHPENVVAQWATEWGGASLLAGAAILFALRPVSALARSTPAVGAWSAVACVALHNLVDFSSETPAVVLALCVCVAIIVAGSAGTRGRSRLEAWSRAPKELAVGLFIVAAVAIALVVPGMAGELDDDRADLRQAALDPNVTNDAFRAAVRGAMLRHPAEPYMPFTGALRASHAGTSVVPWIERTLERAPVYGPAHLLLARELVTKSPAQARLEYRIAMIQDPALLGPAVNEALRLVAGFYDAMELVPPGKEGVPVLEFLAIRVADRLPATRQRLDDEERVRDSTAVGPALRAAADAKRDLEDGEAAPWCASDRPACVTRSLAIAERAKLLEPNKCEGYAARATILTAAGDSKRALDELQAATDRVQDRASCLKALAALAIANRDESRATDALDNLVRMGCASDVECMDNLVYVASVEEQRGNVRRALALYQRARERDPERRDLTERVALLSSRAGMHAEALDAYRSLQKMQPDEAAWGQAISREEMALVHEVLPR